jgi:hypothetical protein
MFSISILASSFALCRSITYHSHAWPMATDEYDQDGKDKDDKDGHYGKDGLNDKVVKDDKDYSERKAKIKDKITKNLDMLAGAFMMYEEAKKDKAVKDDKDYSERNWRARWHCAHQEALKAKIKYTITKNLDMLAGAFMMYEEAKNDKEGEQGKNDWLQPTAKKKPRIKGKSEHLGGVWAEPEVPSSPSVDAQLELFQDFMKDPKLGIPEFQPEVPEPEVPEPQVPWRPRKSAGKSDVKMMTSLGVRNIASIATMQTPPPAISSQFVGNQEQHVHTVEQASSAAQVTPGRTIPPKGYPRKCQLIMLGRKVTKAVDDGAK